MPASKKILILGAGFGGLRAATQIAKKLKKLGLAAKYKVILVDKNEHHTYTPLLYEVATTSKNTANMCHLHEVAAYDTRSLVRGLPIQFVQDEVSGLDSQNGEVRLRSAGRVAFDYAVIALGAEASYFDIKGLKENSLPLKEFLDAIKIRDRIWNLAMEGKHIKVIVGGGGSTGVEFAGELKTWCGELMEDLPKCRIEIEIVEGGPSVLAGFPERIIRIITKRLEKLGIKITVGRRIVEVRKGEVVLDGDLKNAFDILVWAGGVRAPELLANMSLKLEQRGRALVEKGMQVCVPEDSHLHLRARIYGIGDITCFYNPTTGEPIPGVARAAISQANVAAHNLVEDIKSQESGVMGQVSRIYEPKHKTYKPMDYPYIIPVGGKWAVAKVGPFIVHGFLGWVLKGLVELNYLLSIMPFWRAVKTWLKGLWIFVRNDRLG